MAPGPLRDMVLPDLLNPILMPRRLISAYLKSHLTRHLRLEKDVVNLERGVYGSPRLR